MVVVNEVGIRWKDNALIRGGLADMMNSFFLRKSWSKACRKKSADAIVVQYSITLHEGQNLTIKGVTCKSVWIKQKSLLV